MDIILRVVAGLDIGKKLILACRRRIEAESDTQGSAAFWNNNARIAKVMRVVTGMGNHACCDGSDGSLLEADLERA